MYAEAKHGEMANQCITIPRPISDRFGGTEITDRTTVCFLKCVVGNNEAITGSAFFGPDSTKLVFVTSAITRHGLMCGADAG
jgi:hypothetical protein